MRIKKYLPVLALCVLTAGCASKKGGILEAGIDLANLDTTALPGTDFYQYACGGWMKNHPLTDEYARLGTFDLLAENNRKQIRDLITELAQSKQEEGSVAQKIGDLYNMAMDSVKLDKDGMEPVKADLQKIGDLKDKKAIYSMIGYLQQEGVNPYFYLYVGADDMNSSMNLTQVFQGGLGMGERDYYLEKDEKTTAVREAYKVHVAKMFQLAGFDETAAQKATKAVMDIEMELAKISRTKVALRDPHANYNKKTLADWEKEYPSFGWSTYMASARLDNVKDINIGQPEFMKEVEKVINTFPLADNIAYLQWNLINSSADYLSDAIAEQNFDFYGKTMSGKKEMQPRWKRAVGVVSSALGEAVGQMYVKKYFPETAKQRMVALVKNLQKSLGERISNLSWMSDTTKHKALDKLAAFHVKIGYPDKWKDYSKMEIKNDNYWSNVTRANLWEYNRMLAKIGQPVDKDEWHMTPQTVNAYYNPTTNEICFPAGILQYPFFDMNADDAFNYGAIGVVIGHEMTHGFDDQGRQYDKDGNLKDWWTDTDAENFKKRAEVMATFFDSIQVAPGVHGNGHFTLGENIADHGGLQVSFQAYKNATANAPLGVKDGFTADQRFFLAYANVWAGNIRDAEILRRTKIDPHSLGKWRVDGALPQIGAWYDAFGITEKDPMFLPVEKRVSIW